jgi:hypothetical protein
VASLGRVLDPRQWRRYVERTAVPLPLTSEYPDFDFHGAKWDLDASLDREVLRFILSQALFGEATGVYCGKSLYAAGSLEAARFYVRQARQELGHLQVFADIFRVLDMEPEPAHWVLKLLSSHNNYYPLKVLLEHAIGEGMVMDVFKDILMQTIPDADERGRSVLKKLHSVCREEAEHVAWGEKETVRILAEKPWLKAPFYGLVELQLATLPLLVGRYRTASQTHPVMKQLPAFVEHVQARVRWQGEKLGYAPPGGAKPLAKLGSMVFGAGLYLRSQFSKSKSTLDKTYLTELGFGKGS